MEAAIIDSALAENDLVANAAAAILKLHLWLL